MRRDGAVQVDDCGLCGGKYQHNVLLKFYFSRVLAGTASICAPQLIMPTLQPKSSILVVTLTKFPPLSFEIPP